MDLILSQAYELICTLATQLCLESELVIKSQKRGAFWVKAAHSDLSSPSGMLSHFPACTTDQNGAINMMMRSR